MDELEWGISKLPGIDHSPDMDCINCNYPFNEEKYSWNRSWDNKIKSAIGVRRDESGLKSDRPYILICNCPSCFTKYQHHISENQARLLKEQVGKRNLEDENTN